MRGAGAEQPTSADGGESIVHIKSNTPTPAGLSTRDNSRSKVVGMHSEEEDEDPKNRPQAIEICVSCKNLPEDADFMSPCDPCVVVFFKKATFDSVHNEWAYSDWEEYGRTETISDTINPRFCQYIQMTYTPKVPQPLRFCVYDWEGTGAELSLGNHTALGQHEVYLSTIMQTQGKRIRAELDEMKAHKSEDRASSRLGQRFKDYSMTKRSAVMAAPRDGDTTARSPKPRSAMARRIRDARLRAEHWETSGSLPHIELAASLTNDDRHLPSHWARLEIGCEISNSLVRKAGGGFSDRPDCFLEVLRDSDGVFDLLFRSEVQHDSRKPRWRPFATSLARLCRKNVNNHVRMVVYDWRPMGAHIPLGLWQGPVRYLQQLCESPDGYGKVALSPAQKTSLHSTKKAGASLSRAATRKTGDSDEAIGMLVVRQCRTFMHRDVAREQADSGGAVRPEEMTLAKDMKFLLDLTTDDVCRRQPVLTRAVQECLWGMHEADQLTNIEVVREVRMLEDSRPAGRLPGTSPPRPRRPRSPAPLPEEPSLEEPGLSRSEPVLRMGAAGSRGKKMRASKRLGGCWIRKPAHVDRLLNGEPSRDKDLQRLLRPSAMGYVDVADLARMVADKKRATDKQWAYNLMRRSHDPTAGWKVDVEGAPPPPRIKPLPRQAARPGSATVAREGLGSFASVPQGLRG